MAITWHINDVFTKPDGRTYMQLFIYEDTDEKTPKGEAVYPDGKKPLFAGDIGIPPDVNDVKKWAKERAEHEIRHIREQRETVAVDPGLAKLKGLKG